MNKISRFNDSEKIFRCPICKRKLKLVGNSLLCSNKHCFDISKLGYVNLVLNQKQSKHYKEALESCDKLSIMLENDISTEIFRADCTMLLPEILPDIIITDVPYGNLVEWEQGKNSINDMLEQLWRISHENTILAVCMDKKQKVNCEKWERLEKQNIGKRKFEILKKK